MLRPYFVGSFPRADVPLDPPLPELALIGRSNVGKSSLLNALVGQRIAKVSATPGKTRSLNVFLLDIGSGEWGVVRDGENRPAAARRQVPLPTPHAFYFLDLPATAMPRRARPTARRFTACSPVASSGRDSPGSCGCSTSGACPRKTTVRCRTCLPPGRPACLRP